MKKTKKPVHKAAAHKTAVTGHMRKKHHHKPYLFRHVSLFVVALVVLLFCVLQLGVIIGRQSDRLLPASADEPVSGRLSSVRSSLGFSFGYDTAVFETEASEGTNTVIESDLRTGRKLTRAVVRPRAGAVSSHEAAAQLIIEVSPDKDLTEEQTAEASQRAAQVYQPKADGEFDVTQVSSEEDMLSGVAVRKTIFRHTPKFGTLNQPIYSIQWAGSLQGHLFAVSLEGLIGNTDIPAAFVPVFDTLNLKGTSGVLGASISLSPFQKVSAETTLEEKYLTDALSPAVVKIYQVGCGVLVVEDNRIGGDACDASTGSGFFVSSDGYIATSGHVVVYEAEDALVRMLMRDPNSLAGFLKYIGLSDAQIAAVHEQPNVLAAIIAEIYNAPPDVIRFENGRNTLLVSLGAKPLSFSSMEDVKKAASQSDTDDIKKAELVDFDYAAKDVFVIASGDEEGFTSSDVALLKIDAKDTPYMQLLNDRVTQNQKITIIGFPGDADNELTDNSSLAVSATNGSISAIRAAAGSRYKLYQSDGDASQGNSGGPAVTEDGLVLGLLTYRFKNATAVDAAKSYIRDIDDLRQLADENDIVFKTEGGAQEHWENGLSLYSQNRFSKAIEEFEKTQDLFPAHRLAGGYIDSAEEAIEDGRDVKDLPLVALVVGALIGGAGIGMGVLLIARHRAHNQAYKMAVAPDHNFWPHPEAH